MARGVQWFTAAACRVGVVLGLLAGALLPAWAQKVAFINPGKSDEAYWVSAAKSMEAAARSLGATLEVRYAQRQFPLALEIAREIAERPRDKMPDYVIVANEGAAGPELLRILAGKTRVFMAFSGITQDADVQAAGAPRQQHPQWIGSLEPRADEAGYVIMKALIDKARAARLRGPDGKIHVLAITGDRSATTSVERTKGMRRAIEQAPDVVLDQEVSASFNRQKAQEVASELFARFPGARVVWAGSDQMAFGAMQALEQRGGVPGRDVLFAGINTSREALQALKSGRLSALAGGHFILGAWALVMIHDHFRGIDFARDEGLALNASMFVSFTPRDVDVFLARYGEDHFESIDFRQFSKAHNRRLKRYDFSFRPLLK